MDMFNESLLFHLFSQTLIQASISLLVKKDKDSLTHFFYHPKGLLNVDFKLLFKSLALHLESVLPSIISLDLFKTGILSPILDIFYISTSDTQEALNL